MLHVKWVVLRYGQFSDTGSAVAVVCILCTPDIIYRYYIMNS